MTWPQHLVGFDTETTGVDVATDRIVTAAVVRRDDAEQSWSWLLDPGVEIPAGATAVHGITTEHARRHGRPPAPALVEIADHLAHAARNGEGVVAFNAAFDLSLLDAELTRHGLATLAERAGGPLHCVVDPLVLDRHLDRFRRGKRTLADLCRVYAVVPEMLHAADADVRATLDVLTAMLQRHPQIAAMSLVELHELQVRAHRTWAERFNTWRREQGMPGPGAELTWPVRT